MCTSLITHDVEHYICLFATCLSSLVTCLLRSSVYFLIRFVFVLLGFMYILYIFFAYSSLHIPDTSSLLDTSFANVFSQSVVYFFIL